MSREILTIIISVVAAILFFIAIFYPSWDCSGGILGSICASAKSNEIVGILLILAAVFVTLAALFLILSYFLGSGWMDIAALVLAVIAAILAIAGVFYYISVRGVWSPVIAAIAMALTVALALILIFELF